MGNMSKKTVILVLCLLTIVIGGNIVFANPARPRPTNLVQPDGYKFTATLKGDEHFAFAETPDGYSIITNKETGYWCYAQKENGLIGCQRLHSGSKRLSISQKACVPMPWRWRSWPRMPIR